MAHAGRSNRTQSVLRQRFATNWLGATPNRQRLTGAKLFEDKGLSVFIEGWFRSPEWPNRPRQMAV